MLCRSSKTLLGACAAPGRRWLGMRAGPLNPSDAPVFELGKAKSTVLSKDSNLVVRRSLPRVGRRQVGPWCLVDVSFEAPRQHLLMVNQSRSFE
jgi:hypothetical protein